MSRKNARTWETLVNWAPIVLFTYDRLKHARETIEALAANDGARESDLVIYSDGPKTVDREEAVRAVREYVRSVSGFKSVTVVERAQNMGLSNSVIAGVSDVLTRSASVIVMEDDLVTTRNFLAFVNAALSTYGQREDVFSVTGYNYPIAMPKRYREDAYLSHRSTSWGWGTWRDRWSQVDWSVGDYAEFAVDSRERERFSRGGDDLPLILEMQMAGKIDSWDVCFCYSHYKHDALCLHPVVSKVQNIGFDGSGVHCTESDDYTVELDRGDRPFQLRPDLTVDRSVLRAFERRYRPSRQRLRTRLGLGRVKRRLGRLARLAAT
ncbi:MAG TPA: hypothetical protein VKR79_03235 [Gaiellaceae bacterium]|nr:hypothetical protein [Gaiellaceae bacterium]